MVAPVVELAPRRASRGEPGDDGSVCPCGSAWFVLVPPPSGARPAVTITDTGRITGYFGVLACRECDAIWAG